MGDRGMDTVMILRTSNNDTCLDQTMEKPFVVFHLPPLNGMMESANRRAMDDIN